MLLICLGSDGADGHIGRDGNIRSNGNDRSHTDAGDGHDRDACRCGDGRIAGSGGVRSGGDRKHSRADRNGPGFRAGHGEN